MEKLGEYLKAAREAKGLSISEMAERTRISATFLQAIEKGDYSAIPGEVFVSGFIRSYARELGLKQKDVMARYREAVSGAREKGPEPPEEPDRYAPPEAPGVKAGYKKLVYALAVGLAAAVAVYFLTGPSEGPAPKPVSPPVTAGHAEGPPASFTHQTTSFNSFTTAKAAKAEPGAVEEPQPPARRAGISLKISARERTWYNLVVDGSKKKSGLLEPGGELGVTANKELVLDLGNAGGVDIEFNGKPVRPFGPPGTVRKGILFTKDRPGVITKHLKAPTLKPHTLTGDSQ